MKQVIAEEVQIEQIARTVASESHAAMLWRDRDWDWYQALRDAILRMLRRDEQLGMRHLQFAWFVQTFLTAAELSHLSENERFEAHTGSPQLRDLLEPLPRWTVDECDLFS
jgi:hypothetical protein